ncbi:MAG: prephenate dehydrogenase/arogenate dehydrogenase family protein [Ignavibacteriales bacterium]|nr:prephenate dehydrogenase/arogenate dehydrogenase family protein [Ignavibacteriales bacterium]
MKNISIIGLGLIGGSIAKGLKKSNSLIRIHAFDKPEVTARAITEGMIDAALNSIEDAADDDIIFMCLPLEPALQSFEKLSPILKENSILTDVCGIKGVFEEKWKGISSKGIYIGGHPMTGKEKGGYENSDPLLFENAVYILSDVQKANGRTDDLAKLIKMLGARIIFLDPYLHDKVVANVSHLPQLLAVSLVNTAAKGNNKINNLDFAAGGFRDMTRIASSDFQIWDSVLKLNGKEILSALTSLQNELEEIKNYLLEDSIDELKAMFVSAATKRDGIPKDTKGFMYPLHDVYVFVNDVPGIISKISTALFNSNINIKDIELLKIREGTGGTFRVAFESEKDASQAKEILKGIGFTTN